ncbi:MAG: hypothetical protein SOY32_03085, partial [Candidatus Faecousia sp.]|nr:hypothetical protein [Candidatus Faecousia sp.]
MAEDHQIQKHPSHRQKCDNAAQDHNHSGAAQYATVGPDAILPPSILFSFLGIETHSATRYSQDLGPVHRVGSRT